MQYYTPQKRRSPLRKKRRNPLINNRIHSQKNLFSNLLEADSQKRLFLMIVISSAIIFLLIVRLFYIQILNGKKYEALAKEQQYGKIIIPAKRGEILTKNVKNGEINKLATNITLDLVYIDPKEIPDKKLVAKKLAPILFAEEDFLACKEDYKLCPSGGVQFDESQILLENKEIPPLKDTRTKEQLITAYEKDLLEKISKEKNDYSPLVYGASDEQMEKMEKLSIPGVYVVKNKNLIYANPLEINQKEIKAYAKLISPILSQNEKYIRKLLEEREIRYIPLKRKLRLEASEKIWELKTESFTKHKQNTVNIPHYFKGVVLLPEHWRFYPEKNLASTIIGYTDHEGIGRYGIEEKFDSLLRGKSGIFLSQNDVEGSQLIFDISKMTEAINGDSIVLTIDRIIQKKVQELLQAAVKKYRADSGTIIVSDPFTGEILALGNYPNFDPNNFGEVYQTKKVSIKDFTLWGTAEEAKNNIYPTQPVFIKDQKGVFKEVNYAFILEEKEKLKKIKNLKTENKNNPTNKDNSPYTEKEKFIYKNRFGLRTYINKAVMELYEPGSVFKPIAMAIGLDAKEVNPHDTYNEDGPIEIDTGTGDKQYIHTALDIYRGLQTMTNAIEQSSNIGMAYVARKLGRELFYKYILDFGFGNYSYIELSGEKKGQLTFWKKWPEAQLLTTAFGQGISVTPIQMIQSWNALANGGVIIQPKIIQKFIKADGTEEEVKTKIVRRVISQDASQKISGMLVSSVENGVANPGKVPGYKVAGKTGTSQIACSDSSRCRIGKYERGEGTTITSYGGYAPIQKPKFVILVRFERPRIGDNTWGSTTAAPVFKELAEFLLHYYDIKPDDPESLEKPEE